MRFQASIVGTGLSAQQHEVIVGHAPIMIWRADVSGDCDYFNERWLRFRGRSVDQEIGNGWAEGVHPDDLNGCLTEYHAAFSRRERFEIHYRLRRYDGAYRWIYDCGSPYFGDDGQFCGYIGSCLDVTERIEPQKAADYAKDRELATLRGLLRICMVCKKIRNEDGSWDQIEKYIATHIETDFSHGICPECLATEFNLG